ncbi:hypothetical protein [Kribbella sp. NPDC051620]|uniref:hypothetical protein n=1 Tax=Kribbella sp. NPDC051620 TaxID=3364120 RepID=UPI0037926239
MIDEKELSDRLADAASAQDNLLPRALSDDLAAGRRRLRRHRVLTGSGVVGGAAAVAVLVLGMTSWLSTNAGHSSPPVGGPTGNAIAPNDVREVDAAFNGKMRGLFAKHFDPGVRHLTFENAAFAVNRQPGQEAVIGQAGWKIAGQQGRSLIDLGLYGSGDGPGCGHVEGLKPVCHSTTMPDGGSATIGRVGDRAEIQYRQPDGEVVYLAVRPWFGTGTTTGAHEIGITDAELMSFVADPELNLPPMTAEEVAAEQQLKDYAPHTDEVLRETNAILPGDTVDPRRIQEIAGRYIAVLDWTNGSLAATVEFGANAKPRARTCEVQLSVPSCTPLTLPDGKKLQYYQGARSYGDGLKYVMGATYVQPDGDLASVRILYPGTALPAGAATKDQLIELVTDPVFDK